MTAPRPSPPPVFPRPPPPRSGPFRRTPPAIFPPILGLLGLGLAWRIAVARFDLPAGVVEAYLGAVTLLWLFAAGAYGAKLARRPAVLADDLRVLPGRGGLAALAMTLPAVALVVEPYRPGLATALLLGGIAVHLGLIALFVAVIRAGPPEGRGVTPVWQPMCAGLVVSALPALALGWTGLAMVLAGVAALVASAVWLVSAVQMIRRIPPAPLRPLLVLHLAPAAVLGLVAQGLSLPVPAQGCAVLGGAILLALVVSARWVLQAGLTPFWGAMTFPLAAYAGLLLSLEGGWRQAGALVLVAATLLILPVAYRVLQDWLKGSLATKTNAAEA